MSLRPGLSIAILSTVFVSQMILHTDAQSGVASEGATHHLRLRSRTASRRRPGSRAW